MLVKLLVSLIAVSLLLAVIIQGYRSILTSLDRRVVDPVRINGNPRFDVKDNSQKKDISMTLLRHNLLPGDLVQHSPVTTINNDLCGVGQCNITYQGRVCDDQSNVPSEMIRVSWLAYSNESGVVRHIDNIVNDQENSGNFNRHFGSCILPCSECPLSNIVDVSMVRKIINKNDIFVDSNNLNFSEEQIGNINTLCSRDEVQPLYQDNCLTIMKTRLNNYCNKFTRNNRDRTRCINDTLGPPSRGYNIVTNNIYDCLMDENTTSIQDAIGCTSQSTTE